MASYISIVLSMLLIGLGTATQEANQTLPSDEATKVMDIGEKASQHLVSGLKSALIEAMQNGGPSNAVSVCKDTAQKLTAQISNDLGKGISVKRTSLKYRNPANAPDDNERSVLERYEIASEKSEQIPPYILQKIATDDGWMYRYYKPLKVMPLCLNCHGSKDQIDPAVQKVLREQYPDDRATGYESGDFRGVVSVTIAEQALKTSNSN